MKTLQFCLFLLFSFFQFFSQNENSKWYFAKNVAIDFMTNPPSSPTNSSTMLVYPASSIADEGGNLLFFTDGKTVWNKQKVIMANGTNLQSHPGVYYQSPLIIKQPGSQNIYYVFTIDSSLKYSIIDINLSAGSGSVITKNNLVYNKTSLKFCATKHCNGKDVWIISHELNTNNFRSYLLSNSGLNTTPVISSAGTSYTLNGIEFGHLKFSPTGKKVGAAIFRNLGGPSGASSIYEIYDFDKSTGIVSNALTLGINFSNTWSCEFSADGSKFYGSHYNGPILYQWDLCAGSNSAIIGSQDTVANVAGNYIAGLQLASNGKIYVTSSTTPSLGLINSPNNSGTTCNFVTFGQSISSGTLNASLPSFVSSSLKTPFTFSSGLSCYSVSFTSSYLPSAAVCTNVADPINFIEWDFGEPSSGAANTSTLISPVHQYSAPGTYKVKLAVQSGFCVADTIVQFVTLSPPPPLNLSGNYTICPGISSTLNVSGANSYTWSTGLVSNSISLSPSVTTVYSVTGSFSTTSCTSLKTFTVVRSKCVGISEDDDLENKIRIFPNPFNDEFYIDTKIPISVCIYNPLGILINKVSILEGIHSINTSHFPNGVYILQLSSGKQKIQTKIIKVN